MKNPSANAGSPGFTLVELLVVIVIIITLAALSVTGISRMRNSADRITATRNLSQLQLANSLVATDNSGKFIPTYSFDKDKAMDSQWYSNPKFLACLKTEEATYTSTSTNYTIPLGMLDPLVVKAKKKGYDVMSASYGYVSENTPGGKWGDANAAPSFSLSQLTAPERSAVFMTSTDWIAKYSGRFNWRKTGAVEGKTGDGKVALRHGNKALVVYYDGHVGEITLEGLKVIDQQGGIDNLFWNAGASTTKP